MSYPDTVNLPFNSAAIRDGFTPLKPGDAAPEGPGFWLVLQGSALVVGEGFRLPEGDRPAWLDPVVRSLCIGLWRGKPLRAATIGRGSCLSPPFVAEPFNAVADRLDDRLLTLGGLAHQILHWERVAVVCSRCGGGLDPIPGTWGKKCRSCRHEYFLPVHPCVIVFVRRGDEFLLVRKADWPSGRYSLIAGFVEPGESLEECVHREVGEEAGVTVKNLRYVGSQNWPFPSQLMAGFVADYAAGEIRIDEAEIEDARWFSAIAMPESLPARRSIARYIIDTWTLKGKDEL
jgi:NAD+ diphosphatase